MIATSQKTAVSTLFKVIYRTIVRQKNYTIRIFESEKAKAGLFLKSGLTLSDAPIDLVPSFVFNQDEIQPAFGHSLCMASTYTLELPAFWSGIKINSRKLILKNCTDCQDIFRCFKNHFFQKNTMSGYQN